VVPVTERGSLRDGHHVLRFRTLCLGGREGREGGRERERERERTKKTTKNVRGDAIRKIQEELQWIVAQRLRPLSALTPGLNLSRLHKSYHFRHPKLH